MKGDSSAVSMFQRSLNPVLTVIRLSGVDLMEQEQTKATTLWLVYSLMILGLDIVCCVHVQVMGLVQGTTPTTAWSVHLDSFVFYSLTAATHIALVYSSRSTIQPLWTSMKQFDSLMDRDSELWRQFRSTSYKATLFIIVSDFVYVIWGVLSSPQQLWFQAIRVVVLSSHRLLIKCCVIYSVFGFGFVSIFNKINEEVKKSTEEEHLKLLGWYKMHGDVCSAVDLLVETFRFVLLFATLQAYFVSITTCFQLSLQMSGVVPGWNLFHVLWYAAEVMEFALIFWMVCYTSDQIEKKASLVLKTLHRVELNNLLDSKSNKFMVHPRSEMFFYQNSRNLPCFSILGLFKLSQNLIPTLVGTVLTYCVILWQFKSY